MEKMEKNNEGVSYVFQRRSDLQSPYSNIAFSSVHSRCDDQRTQSNEIHLQCLRTDCPHPNNRRRKRICYTHEQTQKLREVFSQTRYPCRLTYAYLSQLLSVPEPSLKIWFKNHRARHKCDVTQPTTNGIGQEEEQRLIVPSSANRIQSRMQQCFTSSSDRCHPCQPIYRPQARYMLASQLTYNYSVYKLI